MSVEAIVFSDLHFGDARSLLHTPGCIEDLAAKLSVHRPARRIVLLGDILDLQMGNWAGAVEGEGIARGVGFRRFINRVLETTGARTVHYVPGNHDYRLFDYLAIEERLMKRLASGRRLDGKVHYYRTYQSPFLRGVLSDPGVSFDVTFPHLTLRLGSHRLVLTHGHFLDRSQGFGVDCTDAFRDVRTSDRRAVRSARHRFFRRVGLYQSIIDGGSVNREVRKGVYGRAVRWLNAVSHSRSASHGRRREGRLHRNILSYLEYCCRRGRVDGFCFGHTHRATRAVIARPGSHPVLAWNCGTFLDEGDASIHPGTFLVVSKKARATLDALVRLERLGP